MTLDPFVSLVETPAFVWDERVLASGLDQIDRIRDASGCRVLYALKPMTCQFVLERMRGRVDGLAVSSLFEAQLARSVLGDAGTIHITTPGLRESEMEQLDSICDYFAFNSLSQLERLGPALVSDEKAGLRVNPGLSFVEDDRYNPCRAHSKLGVPLKSLRKFLRNGVAGSSQPRGLLFHSHCDAVSFKPLARIARLLVEELGDWLETLSWVNLGGGYLFDDQTDLKPLRRAVDCLRARGNFDIFFEPGAALVRKAGCVVSEVIDLFRSQGKTVAVLDTTVNHFPEVFEYQFEPDVLGHSDDGTYEYILVGCSCLAGDILGEYAFLEPLRLGSRVVLLDMGAYALVKSHMFNGINLPSIYELSIGGELCLRRSFSYDDFLARSGVSSDVAL